MKLFTNKNIIQKIIIAIVIVVLINFIAPNAIMAETDFGGVLFTPIQYLVLGLGDAVMYFASVSVTGEFGVDNVVTLSTDGFGDWLQKAYDFITKLTAAAITNPMLNSVKNASAATIKAVGVPSDIFPQKIDLPLFAITPEKIFSNDVSFLDIDIINADSGDDSAAATLQSTISSWYIALRNLAIVGMLSILVYVGIRIILSSTATDKAKYKQLIKDWLIAICLLFFMHYIMSFAITLVEQFTNALKQTINTPVLQLDLSKFEISEEEEKIFYAVGNEEPLDKANVYWPTDFTGLARFRAQLNYESSSSAESEYVAEGGKAQMAYTIIYAVLVIYTIMFLFQYLKRLIYIIFLTMIAPLVALTYPIDKMNDESAQAFNTWLKEYIYNLLIQPFHLVLYCILIGSAIDLAQTHLIYTLAVLGFMLPGEKILRKFFGFDKGATGASIMSGAVGGAMVMSVLGNITSRAKGGAKKNSSGKVGAGNSQERVRMADNRTPDNSVDDEDRFLMEALGGRQGQQGDSRGRQETEDSDNGQRPPLDLSNDETNDGNETFNKQEQIDKLGEELDNYTNGEIRMSPELQANQEQYNQLTEENAELEGKGQEVQTQPANAQDTFERPSLPDLPEEQGPAITGPSKKFRRLRAAAPILGRGAIGLGKGIIKTYGAATLGTIGVAAGLASEKYSNVLGYGAAGAAGGTALTGAIMNKGKALPSDAYRKYNNLKDEYTKNLYKDNPAKYREEMNKQADKAFMKDKQIQQLYRDKFGTEKVADDKGNKVEKYKFAMEEAKKYREHGITDNETIIKAMKAKVRGVDENNLSANQRIAAAKYASQISNEKDIQTMSDRLRKRGIGKEQIEIQENILRQMKGLN